ncbi:MAG: LysR family transcriptional regulator [Alphaproteobacteria bacterium]|nr:LysR family transcriptional regulator [Alphaproteobacteria bacterium]
MTDAAHILGLTQPAISQTVKHLEEGLGVPLLDRQARPIRPTAEGEKLYRAAQDLIARSAQVIVELREHRPFPIDRLSVAIVDSLAGTLAPKIVQRMDKLVGRWQFFAGLTPDREHAFFSGRCDLAIVAEGEAATEFQIDQYLLLREPFLKIFPRDYDRDPHDLRDVSENLKFVRYSLGSTAGRTVEQHLNRLRIGLPLWIETDNPTAQLDHIASGTCWGYLTPTFLLTAPHLLDQVRVVYPRGAKFYRRIFVLVRRGELGDLPEQLTEGCRDAIANDLLPTIVRRYPWISDLVEVPGFTRGGFSPDAADGTNGH